MMKHQDGRRPFNLAWIFLFCLGLIPLTPLSAKDMVGRMGIGMTNNYMNGIPAISLKLQRTQLYGVGAMLGVKLSNQDNRGGYAGGLKFYRNIFDEPNLNFYGAGALSLININNKGNSETGFQIDATLGSEFHFTGLESLGFSFEFGLSLNRLYGDFVLETIGNHLIRAAIHFYL